MTLYSLANLYASSFFCNIQNPFCHAFNLLLFKNMFPVMGFEPTLMLTDLLGNALTNCATLTGVAVGMYSNTIIGH